VHRPRRGLPAFGGSTEPERYECALCHDQVSMSFGAT
jgi:hypothetical protein